MQLCIQSGPSLDLKAIVDTGAEVNLIRPGLVPGKYFRQSSRLIHFIAVNQTTLSGGHRELEGTLKIQGVEVDSCQPEILSLPFVCFDADMEVDILLSYGWLAAMHLDVMPRRHGLMSIQSDRQIWIAGEEERIRPSGPGVQIGVLGTEQSHTTNASKDYKVRPEYFAEIISQLGLKPTVDCFATATNTQCHRFFTKEQNALTMDWPSEDVMWMNPPWTLWPEAEAKLSQARCAAVAICPGWAKPWVKNLVSMASRKVYFEQGTRLFELNGKPMAGTFWGTWALRIDKGPRKTFDAAAPLKGVYFSPSWRPVKAISDQSTSQETPEEPNQVNIQLPKTEASVNVTNPNSNSDKTPLENSLGKPRMLYLFSGTGS